MNVDDAMMMLKPIIGWKPARTHVVWTVLFFEELGMFRSRSWCRREKISDICLFWDMICSSKARSGAKQTSNMFILTQSEIQLSHFLEVWKKCCLSDAIYWTMPMFDVSTYQDPVVKVLFPSRAPGLILWVWLDAASETLRMRFFPQFSPLLSPFSHIDSVGAGRNSSNPFPFWAQPVFTDSKFARISLQNIIFHSSNLPHLPLIFHSFSTRFIKILQLHLLCTCGR